MLFLVVGAIVLAVKYWYVSVPVFVLVLLLAVLAMRASARAEEVRQAEAVRVYAEQQAAQQAADAEAARVHRVQQAAAAEARRQAEADWLASPAPTLYVPGRFTDRWFAEHAAGLHPGQVSVLIDELHERGWTDERIARRVLPHLRANPYLDPDNPIPAA
jgi:hypothetical protein